MPSASAWADPPPWAPAHGKRAKDRALYDSYGRYYEPRRLSRDDRVWRGDDGRSEEHTSELQSLMRISYAVFCLKKKTKHKHYTPFHTITLTTSTPIEINN